MKKAVVLTFLLFFYAGIVCAANSAQYINQSVPLSMIPGQAYSVYVSMKNAGTTTWTESSGFRMGSQNPLDNWNWGFGRVYLSSAESVAPGQTKTFNFSVTAPVVPGTYNFQWRMLLEGTEWFGDYSANVAVRVSNESPASDDLFGYGVFAGANVLHNSTCWIPDANATDTIMRSAKKMHLRVLRLPILAQMASSTGCWGMGNIRRFLDKANDSGFKVIIELDGYTKYEGACSWKQGFVDVRDGAGMIVSAFKDHPALFAWDLLNEPLWGADNMGCASAADHASVIKAVYSMHDLVRSLDNHTLLTVGEGKDEYLRTWSGITNFASPHIYSTGDEFRDRLIYLKNQSGVLPMIVGEFGIVVPPATEANRAQEFTQMYRTMQDEDVGSMFWLLSTSGEQNSMSPINADGSYKLTANAVENAVPAYNGALFLDQFLPTLMTPGRIYTVYVTMKNTGTENWTESASYRLGSQNPADNLIWGIGRVNISPGESIPIIANKTFAFNVTAPMAAGTYDFQWRMLRESVEWFGEYTPNLAITVVISTTTTTTSTSKTTTSTTTSSSSTTTSTTTTTSLPTTTTSTTTTTTSMHCVMPGNDPPCSEVTLMEAVESIIQWTNGTFSLGGVIDLINSWADPLLYPPF
jgi:hypothetical protein